MRGAIKRTIHPNKVCIVRFSSGIMFFTGLTNAANITLNDIDNENKRKINAINYMLCDLKRCCDYECQTCTFQVSCWTTFGPWRGSQRPSWVKLTIKPVMFRRERGEPWAACYDQHIPGPNGIPAVKSLAARTDPQTRNTWKPFYFRRLRLNITFNPPLSCVSNKYVIFQQWFHKDGLFGPLVRRARPN